MEAALEKVEKAFFMALVFPFVVALRYPNLIYSTLLVGALVTLWYGPLAVGIILLVGCLVVSSLNLGASLEGSRKRRR